MNVRGRWTLDSKKILKKKIFLLSENIKEASKIKPTLTSQHRLKKTLHSQVKNTFSSPRSTTAATQLPSAWTQMGADSGQFSKCLFQSDTFLK